MTMHTPHPDTHEHGLADGCPRCAEHADDPLRQLDARNLRVLLRLAAHRDIPPRSTNEAVAVASVLTLLEQMGKLCEVGGDIVAGYLQAHWGLHADIEPSPVYRTSS